MGEIWESFLTEVYAAVLLECAELCAVQDDEAEPFKSREIALELLEDLASQIRERFMGEWSHSNEPRPANEEVEEKLAVVKHRMGMIAMDCEQSSKGLPLLEEVIITLDQSPDRYLLELQEAHNALGALWCVRAEFQRSKKHLSAAEALYYSSLKRDAERSTSNTAEDELLDGDFVYSEGDGEATLSRTQAVLRNYTMTCFYLAQVYGHLGDAARSAEYCATTLNLQLQNPLFDQAEWAQNSAQLAGFYVGQMDYVSAERCLAAASHVLSQISPKEDNSKHEDVGANLEIAWAKLYADQLRVASERVAADRPSLKECTDSESKVQFKHLPLPVKGPLVGHLPHTYKEAVEIFNLSMPRFRTAAEFYVLDGFVTEHLGILEDSGQLYKYLAVFEKCTHRKCVMYKKRHVALEAVVKQLNPKVFEHHYKQIHFSLGDSHRAVMEMKKEGRWPHKKVLKAGCSAILHYSKFIEIVEATCNVPTDRIAMEDERSYLLAKFCIARTRQNSQSIDHSDQQQDVQCLTLAYKEFESLLEYTKWHPATLEFFGEEKFICEQMVELLPQRIDSIRHGKVLPEKLRSQRSIDP
mmetsp:Transcript_7769/g.14662  ORF Transcript_7769/g.14662 Transcript_7769/m.14662 type:complete len:583 (-) Transcript_7769:212-1960(-)|eukprot:CAMPEP_0114241842 /NCGR_PEP_ID=MMETSP0058-20121206/9847_1 /TAXON_ID=36894 /ORGANISM="Pyramimonas parkeae, CCMP726" /LENGTH=582 /DNA_ID=CAMNT_0001354393 /DNA_START=219 /DNA_END=1967 /DNA_ORIENTATION=-